MKALYDKLATKIGLCLKRLNIPVVVGGSRDLFQSVTDAYLKHSEEQLGGSETHTVTLVSLSHSLDVQPLLSETMSHQTSCKRYLLERLPSNYELVEFGLDGRRVSQ